MLFCMFMSAVQRFFEITDDIPTRQQRDLPRREGGRWHTLANRSLADWLYSYEYAYHMLATGQVPNSSEIQLLVDIKMRMQGRMIKTECVKVTTYRSQPIRKGDAETGPASAAACSINSESEEQEELITESKNKQSKLIRKDSDTTADTDSNRELFEKYSECTICLASFEDGQKVVVLVTCGHLFHQKCCDEWLDYKFKCPNCNLNILPPQQQQQQPAFNPAIQDEEEIKEELADSRGSSEALNQSTVSRSSFCLSEQDVRASLRQRRDTIDAEHEAVLADLHYHA